MPQLPESVRRSIHRFSFWVANRSVGHPILDGIDYSVIFEEPSALQIAYAVFCNNLDVDSLGHVTNAKYAERRAAEWIRSYCQPGYVVDPPFEEGECDLA